MTTRCRCWNCRVCGLSRSVWILPVWQGGRGHPQRPTQRGTPVPLLSHRTSRRPGHRVQATMRWPWYQGSFPTLVPLRLGRACPSRGIPGTLCPKGSRP